MNKGNISMIIGVIIIGLFLFFYFTGDHGKKYFNWSENYKPGSKQPYGTFIYQQLLKSHYNSQYAVLESSIADNLSKYNHSSLYVLVGEGAYYSYEDIDSLKSYVSAGNDALIATLAFPYDLTYEILSTDCGVVNIYTAEEVDMKIKVKDEIFTYKYVSNQKPMMYNWGHIDSINCPDEIDLLGFFNQDKVNFVRMPYGEGAFYIHTSPLAFTNYYLKDEKALTYVEAVMTYLHGQNLFWDEYSKRPFLANKSKESPLKYILSQPSLKWAWYLLILATGIYFLFYAKRRQRIIPVLEANRNTTIEFAETMGYLYFEEQDHKKIADHKWNLFLAYLRNKYYLHTQVIDGQLVKKVSLKSQVPENEIQSIIKEYLRLDFKVDITAKDLINFHDMIESFYQKSK